MKEKILRYAKGKFEYKPPTLVFSENEVKIVVEAGKTFDGSFCIANNEGTCVKGIVDSDMDGIVLEHAQFQGEKNEIIYHFQAKDCKVGEKIEGLLHIVSDCGEKELPVLVTIEIPSFQTSIGKIRDLYHFAELAKKEPSEALKIFKSSEFSDIFLYRDIEHQILYQGLCKKNSGLQAIEEFLVATHKKQKVILQVSKTNFIYDSVKESFQDTVMLSTNSWGYTEIKVSTDCEFIEPEHKIMWTEQFIGNSAPLRFNILMEKLRVGNNFGSILIETKHQNFQIEILVKTEKIANQKSVLKRKRKDCDFRIIGNYIDFRLNKITPEEYTNELGKIIAIKEESDQNLLVSLLRVHYNIIRENEAEALQLLDMVYPTGKKPEDTTEKSILYYSASLYLRALASKKEEDIKFAGETIERLYHCGYDLWYLLWFLFYLDKNYQKPGVKCIEAEKQLQEGCHSPVLYLEIFYAYLHDLEAFNKLSSVNILPLYWGIRQGLATEDLAMKFTYFAGRARKVGRLLLKCLFALYRQFQLEDTLTAICSLLIRAEFTDKKYFTWYELGVEKQLRITDLYEYYMYSMEEEIGISIPKTVLLYFLYENHLGDRKKAYLYAMIIKNKNREKENYDLYYHIIENFAFGQLKQKHINANLAVIYEEIFTRDMIKNELAKLLPAVMFKWEVTCFHPNMDGVFVLQKESGEEKYVPFVNQKAYVDVYSDTYYFVFEDKQGNRYCETVDYIANKMLKLDDLAVTCFEKGAENEELVYYLFAHSKREYRMTKRRLSVLRKALQTGSLRDYAIRSTCSLLLQYYQEHSEGELLEEMICSYDLSFAKEEERAKWIEYCIIRGLYDKAFLGCMQYGFHEVDHFRLSQLCDYIITEKKDEDETEAFAVKLAWFLFQHKITDERKLDFLAAHFEGKLDDLFTLYQACIEEQMNEPVLIENILGQIIFVNASVSKGVDAFLSYYVNGENRILLKAYLSYICYEYLTGKTKMDETVFHIIQKEMVFEQDKVIVLAMLKKLSEKPELNDKETELVEYHVLKLAREGIVLSFFKEFSRFITLPDLLANAFVIEYYGKSSEKVYVFSQMDETAIKKTIMKEVLDGIYVKKFILFTGETLKYYIDENGTKTEWTVYKKMKADKAGMSMFSCIDEMISTEQNTDQTQYTDSIKRYVEVKQIADDLFKPL